jgi:cyclohexanone monooxygenase
MTETPSTDERFDAIIVGAGFAGMYMLHSLRARGMRVRVIEAAGGVGGTWYWNRYPGARCDVVSVDYSFSFSEEIQQAWTWTEKYAAQPEILRYAEFVADTLDLRRDMQFDTRVESMIYDDAAATWSVTTDAGDHYVAQFCIMATGCLSIPKDPDIPGLSSFDGPVYFTSRWPHEPIAFGGKTVGLIGTGSSGIQVAPEIAQEADRLFVFQRTPSFTLPARNTPLPASFVEEVKGAYSARRQKARRHPAGHLRPITDRKTFSYEPQERRSAFDGAWESGGLDLFGVFGDLVVDEAANDEVAQMIHRKIEETVADPTTAAALKPTGNPLGGRRVCLDTDYYAMFNRENVTLVDVLKDPIETVVADGIRTRDGHYKIDVLVLATGFDAMTGALLKIDIRGRQGLSLRAKWAHGPVTYLGIAVEGFPNLFTITGPGSPSVLTNVIASIEQHVEWLSDLIDHMDKRALKTVEADAQAEEAWVRHVYDMAAPTLMMKANSWYLGANVPGKPRVFMPYVGGLNVYRDKAQSIADDGYRGFHFEEDEQFSKASAKTETVGR